MQLLALLWDICLKGAGKASLFKITQPNYGCVSGTLFLIMGIFWEMYALLQRKQRQALGVRPLSLWHWVWLLCAILMPRRAINPHERHRTASWALTVQRSCYTKSTTYKGIIKMFSKKMTCLSGEIRLFIAKSCYGNQQAPLFFPRMFWTEQLPMYTPIHPSKPIPDNILVGHTQNLHIYTSYQHFCTWCQEAHLSLVGGTLLAQLPL